MRDFIQNSLQRVIYRFRVQLMCTGWSCILARVGWILFFLAACHHLVSAQDSRTTYQQAYNEAVDCVNWRLVNQALGLQNTVMQRTYLSIYGSCETLDADFFGTTSRFLEQENLNTVLAMSREVESLKMEFSKEFVAGDEVDGEDLYGLISEKLFTLPKVKALESRNRVRFPRFKMEVLNYLEEKFEPQTSNAVTERQPAGTGNEYLQGNGTEEEGFQALETETNPEEAKPIRDYLESNMITRKDILWLFTLGMFGLLAFYFIKSMVPEYTVSKEHEGLQINETVTKKMLETLIVEAKTLKVENATLKEELEVLAFRIKELTQQQPSRNAVETLHQQLEERINTSEIDEDAKNIRSIAAPKNHFFMPLPSPTGEFLASLAVEEFKRAETVYEFTLTKDNPNYASFHIYNDVATMIRALASPDEYLKPACRSNEIIPISATKIVTDEDGLAIYRDGKWTVARKAIIRYV